MYLDLLKFKFKIKPEIVESVYSHLNDLTITE